MIPRNGADVAARLGQCSLYEPELDLLVQAPDGDVAAYGLFWADSVTGVGLVEPMRTEQRYWRNGLARHVLTTGLDRLAAHGCTRFKVSSGHGLYLSVGFTPMDPDQTYLGRARSTVPATQGHFKIAFRDDPVTLGGQEQECLRA